MTTRLPQTPSFPSRASRPSTLLRDSILPRTRQSLELTRSDYAKSNVDYATVLSALREVLQVQLQIAQVEAELGKALAGLERALGCQINEHAPAAGAAARAATYRRYPPNRHRLRPRRARFARQLRRPIPQPSRQGRPSRVEVVNSHPGHYIDDIPAPVERLADTIPNDCGCHLETVIWETTSPELAAPGA
ncbi:MAG: TolC family protein [Isosphaerales bacterium]